MGSCDTASLACQQALSWLRSCVIAVLLRFHDSSFPVASRRQHLAADSLALWPLEPVCPLFSNVPWALGVRECVIEAVLGTSTSAGRYVAKWRRSVIVSLGSKAASLTRGRVWKWGCSLSSTAASAATHVITTPLRNSWSFSYTYYINTFLFFFSSWMYLPVFNS